MATAYYDISSQHMIHQISEMTGLLVTQTDFEWQILVRQLAQGTLNILGKFSRIALELKQQCVQ